MIAKMEEGAHQEKEYALTDKQGENARRKKRKSFPAYRIEKISRIAVREGESAFTGDPARPSEKCTGCMSCMAACALSREGIVSSAFSGIRIYHHTAAWVLRKNEILYSSSICRQCPGMPPCDEVCPKHAHYRDSESGAVVINTDMCIRCKQCIDACPYNACWYSEELDKVVKCDVCHGNSGGPQCVTVCPSMILKAQLVK